MILPRIAITRLKDQESRADKCGRPLFRRALFKVVDSAARSAFTGERTSWKYGSWA
jgi:hypothetical protein